MKKLFAIVFTVLTLSACHSGVNFEFATSQDNETCLKENPSHNCATEKN